MARWQETRAHARRGAHARDRDRGDGRHADLLGRLDRRSTPPAARSCATRSRGPRRRRPGLPGSGARAARCSRGEFARAVVSRRTPRAARSRCCNDGRRGGVAELDLRALGLDPLAAPPEPLLGSPAPRSRRRWKPRACRSLRTERALSRAARLRLAVFCDFDGTFAVQDVGATIARSTQATVGRRCGPATSAASSTAWDYNLELLDRLPLPEVELEAFLQHDRARSRRARSGRVVRASSACRSACSPTASTATSNRLQELHGVRFAYDANHLRYEDGGWRIAGAHPNPPCGCGTGTCKRGRIEAFRGDIRESARAHRQRPRLRSVCALAADLVFAKDSLADVLADAASRSSPSRRCTT